ncbi:transaldolase [Ornithinimicrobium sediminis]|uniref:transaldolase n=1 Tax=Ornithinimicrobium sediminis TaxID=2904603 RepID=UPI001E3C842A|nr:transaldolase [Ornithinimicrobium sediminis]MCE0487607.1 transaldolase [Ornithinimicrobium sediminis]
MTASEHTPSTETTPNPNAGAAEHARQAPADTPLAALSAAGVSVWLDDLNRPMITEGDLQALIDERHVVGVTTNPTIFAAALAEGDAYSQQVRELAAQGADVEHAVFALTTRDVRDACDILRPVHDATDGVDGRVSIEVDPRLAADTAGTVEMAQRLWAEIDRPNLFIKIPATVEGLPAITQTLAHGISVNVTLVFSLDRYRGVMNAFLTGLEQARQHGHDLSTIHSVASFFVSRVDSEVDRRLDEIGTDEALSLKGTVALANARLAYQAFEEVFSTPRWQNLADDGAHVQRPLWASTGVKNEDYPDTMYVTELVAPQTVNTMPAATLDATADHARISGDTVTGGYAAAQETLDALERAGVSYTEVVGLLEREGVEKFATSWDELLDTVRGELDKAAGEAT